MNPTLLKSRNVLDVSRLISHLPLLHNEKVNVRILLYWTVGTEIRQLLSADQFQWPWNGDAASCTETVLHTSSPLPCRTTQRIDAMFEGVNTKATPDEVSVE